MAFNKLTLMDTVTDLAGISNGQQLLEQLVEQQLITFDAITVVCNKLNLLPVNMKPQDDEPLKKILIYCKQIRSDLIQQEMKGTKSPANQIVSQWMATLEYQMYDGREYVDLAPVEQVVCLVNDFFLLTKGIWSTADLMILKTALTEVGLPLKDKWSYRDFYTGLLSKPNLCDRLCQELDINGLVDLKTHQAVLLKGIIKLQQLAGQDHYLIDTVKQQLQLAGLEHSEKEIASQLLAQYLKNKAFVDWEQPLALFDLVLELLFNLSLLNQSSAVAIPANDEPNEAKVAETVEDDAVESQENEQVCKLRRQAESGDRDAQFELGLLYFRGEEVEKDFSEVIKWYTKAAAQGHSRAAKGLGHRYYFGEGVEKDMSQAAVWYEKAMEYGDTSGELYRDVGATYRQLNQRDKAKHWLKKAIEVGVDDAHIQIAFVYEDEGNFQQQVGHLRKAANNGNVDAMRCLGFAYYNSGENQSYHDAVYWFNQAAENGDEVSAGWVETVEQSISLKHQMDNMTDPNESKCYLTTAMCDILGKPDDCIELTRLRQFRDQVLLATEQGADLVEQYYVMAPPIAKRLHQHSAKLEIATQMQQRYIAKIINYIDNRNHQAAIDKYKQMVSFVVNQ